MGAVLQNRHAQKRTHPVRLRKTAKCPARHPARRNSRRRLQGRASRCGEPVGKVCVISCAKRFKAAAARPRFPRLKTRRGSLRDILRKGIQGGGCGARFPRLKTVRESLRDILREEIQGGGCRAALPAAENRSGKAAGCPARRDPRRRLQGRASRCGEPVGKGCRVSCAKRFKAAAAGPRFPRLKTRRGSLRDILREEIQGGGCRAALPAAENRSGKFA